MRDAAGLVSADFYQNPEQKKRRDVSTSIKGILRSKKAGKRGVYLRVTIDRDQEYYPTGYYVDAHDFHRASGLVKGKDPQKEAINQHIRYLSTELDDVMTILKRSGDIVSIQNFRKLYEVKFKQQLTFEEYFKLGLKEISGNIEPSTIEVYGRLPKKICEFRPNVALGDIDRKFIKEWESWLLKEKKLCQNTTNHYLETLRTFILKAFHDGLIKENPFVKIKISKIVGERDYLTEEELKAFMEVKIPESHTGELKARERFVFCCLTGIRYSDLVQLKWDHIRQITGDMYFKMQKTNVFVTIPLVEKAIEILNNQPKTGEFVFQSITNQKLNQHLHVIEKRAGIQKNITVHVARHTFATLAIERGIPIEVVSKILGHKSIKMTMIYTKITSKLIHKEMKKMNGLAQTVSEALKGGTSLEEIQKMIFEMHKMMQKSNQDGSKNVSDLKLVG